MDVVLAFLSRCGNGIIAGMTPPGRTASGRRTRTRMARIIALIIPLIIPLGTMLIAVSVAADVEVVVDNDDGAPGYVETGTWTTSTATGYEGGTYRFFMGGTNAPPASATWTADLPQARTYQVFAVYRQSTNRTTGAPITITHADGVTQVSLDQLGANEMVETFLGEFRFEAGTAGSVRMDNGSIDGAYIADAMTWRTPVDPPPEISEVARSLEFPGDTDPVTITARATDNVAVALVTVSYAATPSGGTGTVVGYDDGAHGDGATGDGIYGAMIPAQPEGSVVAFTIAATDDLDQETVDSTRYYPVGPLPPSVPDVVVDNDDGAPAYVETGEWTLSSSVGYQGGTYRYAPTVSGEATHSATWTATLPRAGVYRVYAAFAQGGNRPDSVRVTITHAAGTAVVDLDQQGASEIMEILLGEFPFDEGTDASIRLDNVGTSGACIADAMVWRQPGDPPPVIRRVVRDPVVPMPWDPVTVTAGITDNGPIASAALNYEVEPSGETGSILALDDGVHGDGATGDGVYGATIPGQPDGAIVRFDMAARDGLAQETRSPAQRFVVGNQGGNVYVVLSSDTSVWHGDPGLAPGSELSWRVFTNQAGVLSRVFDPAFRYAHVDSLGQPFRVSWFMMGGAWFTTGANSTPVSALYHMVDNWGADIDEFGDGLDYHFHHYAWDGETWQMAPTFEETIWEFEWVMSEMILDEDVFVTAFRSGWNYMDEGYQQYLERWIPFRMEGRQSDWVPYHPSFADWQQPGTMEGWEVRHIYTKSMRASHAEQAFAAAETGTEQVMCIWSHQNESDFPEQIAAVDQILHDAADAHPAVQFHYCSGREAMQRWMGEPTDGDPPPLDLVRTLAGDTVRVTILTADDIYQEQPWVAARRYDDSCERLDAVKTDVGTWQFEYSRSAYDRVAVGVCDRAGNEAIAEVDDGSRRWTVQSEFARARPEGVDLVHRATRARLASDGDGYTESGTLTFDHAIADDADAAEWRWISIVGEAVEEGTALQCRCKTATTRELLDAASWGPYQAGPTVPIEPADAEQSWVRIEILLEGTGSTTPWLDSVEVFAAPAGPNGSLALY